MVAVIKKGTIFGEVGLISEDSVRTATCIASKDSYLGIISRKDWNNLNNETVIDTLVMKHLNVIK